MTNQRKNYVIVG